MSAPEPSPAPTGQSNILLADALRYYASRRGMSNPKGWAHTARVLERNLDRGHYATTEDERTEAREVLNALVADEEGPDLTQVSATQVARMLEGAGWTQTGGRAGLYARYAPPAGPAHARAGAPRRTVVVPQGDPSSPDYAEMLSEAIATAREALGLDQANRPAPSLEDAHNRAARQLSQRDSVIRDMARAHHEDRRARRALEVALAGVPDAVTAALGPWLHQYNALWSPSAVAVRDLATAVCAALPHPEKRHPATPAAPTGPDGL